MREEEISGDARGEDVNSDVALSVFDVFTPTTQATVNFVDRPTINDKLVDALRTPGKQVIVYGETGSGKSTLLQRKLEQIYTGHITTRCTVATTHEILLLDAFDQLNRYFVELRTGEKGTGLKGALGAEFVAIKASIEANASTKSGTAARRIIPPQLTAQRLGQFLGAGSLCWVLEDFHKVADEQRMLLSQTLKVFSDLASDFPAVKIVAVGATDTARQVVQYDREMANRVAEIQVPLMGETELRLILNNGGKLIGANFSLISGDIVAFSTGLASVCHHLALNACISAGIENVQESVNRLGAGNLSDAVARYLDESSDSLKALFEVALIRKRVRKYDNARLIVTALASAKLDGLLFNEILADIRKQSPSYPASNLTSYLRELASERRGPLLRQSAGGRFRFSEPMFHSYAQILLGIRSSDAWSEAFNEILVQSFRSTLEGLNPPFVLHLASHGVNGQRVVPGRAGAMVIGSRADDVAEAEIVDGP